MIGKEPIDQRRLIGKRVLNRYVVRYSKDIKSICRQLNGEVGKMGLLKFVVEMT